LVQPRRVLSMVSGTLFPSGVGEILFPSGVGEIFPSGVGEICGTFSPLLPLEDSDEDTSFSNFSFGGSR
ncbi:hypothetical protein L9F63_018828, partial [Diploptera punctata]